MAIAVCYAGLPLLGQGAFVAVGAFGAALLARAGAPLGLAVLGAVAIAAALGYLVGFAAARLSGGFLALSTWAFAWLVDEVLLNFPSISGGSAGIVRPAPARLVSPALGLRVRLGPGVHVAFAAVLAVLVVLAVRRFGAGPGGLELAALREGPAVADSLGVAVARRRRAILATAAGLGGLCGAGTGVLLGVVAPGDYPPLLSLELFVAVLLAGTARWWGPLIGVAVLAALPTVADHLAAATGADAGRVRGAIVAGLLGVVLVVRGRLDRPAGGALPEAGTTAQPSATPALPPAPTGAVVVAVEGLRAHFGGIPVLDGVDLEVRAGEVHALVGPNGSGKTTLLRIVAGALPGDAGRVRIGGNLVPPARTQAERVHRGVARTFQRTSLLPGLDPATQVAIGAHGGGPRPFSALRDLLRAPSAARERAVRDAAVHEALAVTGLTERAHVPTATLTSGEQRVLQVARAVATGARAVLLDEPAAGMSAVERTHLADTLHALARRGVAVLLVEHDMRLVTHVADRVSVLADGRVIASGPPGVVTGDREVRRRYLGVEPEMTSREA